MLNLTLYHNAASILPRSDLYYLIYDCTPLNSLEGNEIAILNGFICDEKVFPLFEDMPQVEKVSFSVPF